MIDVYMYLELLLDTDDLRGLGGPGARLAVELAADVEVADVLEGLVARRAHEAAGAARLAGDLAEDAAVKKKYGF